MSDSDEIWKFLFLGLMAVLAVSAVALAAFVIGTNRDEDVTAAAPAIVTSPSVPPAPTASQAASATPVATIARPSTDPYDEDDMDLSPEEYQLTRDVMISQGFDSGLIALDSEFFERAAADLCGQVNLSGFSLGLLNYRRLILDVAANADGYVPAEDQEQLVTAVTYFATSLCGSQIPDE